MGRFYSKVCLAAAAIGIAFAVAGCGGGGGSTSTASTGVEVIGVLAADSRGAGASILAGNGPGELNPNYPNSFLAPTTYSVAISKLELMRGTDDPSPYVVFDRGSVDNAKVITLTGSDSSQSFGENAAYPEPGTYTHIRVTMVYQDLTIPTDIGDGEGYGSRKFRVYSSTVGTVEDGDVLVEDDGVYNWICGGTLYPVTGARPVPDENHRLVQHHQNAQDTEDSPDPLISTAVLSTPMVVPANPTGKFTINATFDVTTSPEAPGSTGIFMFDDVTPDGMFKPGVDMAQGGDGNEAEYATKGAPDWTPLAPVINFSYVQE